MEKTQVLMGKSTISMAIFNGYVKLPEGMFGSCLMKDTFELPCFPTVD
jgi:hypothetical protein